jgi:hypothetical protein
MKVLLAHIILLLTSIALTAQPITWQRTYGDSNIDFGYSIVQTPDEGFIVAGRKRINTDTYISALRLNKFGDTLWTRYFTGFKANQIEMLKDGNYLITGVGNLVKLDIDGNVMWSRPGSAAAKFRETKDGGFIQCLSELNGPFLFYPKLRRTDSIGNILWERIFVDSIYDGRFSDICIDSDGNYLLTGNFSDSTYITDNLFVMKTDSLGNLIWFKELPELMYSMSILSMNDNIVIGGELNPRAFMLGLDTNGTMKWLNFYDDGSPKFGTCQSVVAASDGGLAFTGTYQNGDWDYFVRIVKTSFDGKEQWRKLYGFGDADFGLCIRQTYDKGYVVAGTRDNYNLGDVYVIKTDSLGNASPPVSVTGGITILQEQEAEIYNYPNPFNSSTTFQFSIPRLSRVSINLIDINGRTVRILEDREMQSGTHQFSMNASGLASGTYFYSMILNEKQIIAKRLVVIK